MRLAITAALTISAATWVTMAQADVTVMAVRLQAKDVAALAKFYDAAFGLKQIDQVGTPPTEIIMRYGATAAAAKSGTSPEFLIEKREPAVANDAMAHAIFHVSDLAATLTAAKAAGATLRGEVGTFPIGGIQVKIATVVDPDGNVLELMELPKGVNTLPHP
jgi:predicted enzyme related to lactoylglutathione lyase